MKRLGCGAGNGVMCMVGVVSMGVWVVWVCVVIRNSSKRTPTEVRFLGWLPARPHTDLRALGLNKQAKQANHLHLLLSYHIFSHLLEWECVRAKVTLIAG